MKMGTYKTESFNQTLFCYEINPPDHIKIWREDKEGNVDHWWDQEITPLKFHWLVDEWNKGRIAATYPHWWENVDTRPKHINSLLQLSESEFLEALNYAAYILPHYKWTTELDLNSNNRPLFYHGKIIQWINCDYSAAVKHNRKEKANKRFRADMQLFGRTDREIIKEII